MFSKQPGVNVQTRVCQISRPQLPVHLMMFTLYALNIFLQTKKRPKFFAKNETPDSLPNSLCNGQSKHKWRKVISVSPMFALLSYSLYLSKHPCTFSVIYHPWSFDSPGTLLLHFIRLFTLLQITVPQRLVKRFLNSPFTIKEVFILSFPT